MRREAAEGISTGISAQDRALTIKVAAAPDAKPEDIVQPGHVFPLIAQPGGVLVRAGHTEACCDLARLAGLSPAAVLCEIMRDDGGMARLPDLIDFAAQHKLKIGAIADLIEHRSRNESLVQRVSERDIETTWGSFHLVSYRDLALGSIHLALVQGRPSPQTEILVRVHRSEEHTSELQSHSDLVCRLLLEKKNNTKKDNSTCDELNTMQGRCSMTTRTADRDTVS